MKVKENVYQSKLINIINKKYGIALKYQETGTTKTGIPDIIAGINGKIVFIECKTNVGVVSNIQEKQIQKLKRDVTPYVYVARPNTHNLLLKELDKIKGGLI